MSEHNLVTVPDYYGCIKPVVLPIRLAKGKMIIGPDHYASTPTGLAPTLLHIDQSKSENLLHLQFAIGPQRYIETALTALLKGQLTGKASHDIYGRRVRFVRTYKTAKKRFIEMVHDIEMVNKEARARHLQSRSIAMEE